MVSAMVMASYLSMGDTDAENAHVEHGGLGGGGSVALAGREQEAALEEAHHEKMSKLASGRELG